MKKPLSLMLLPVSILWQAFTLPFSARGRARDRIILAVIFVFVLGGVFVDHPRAWDRFGAWANPKIDSVAEKIGGDQLAWRVGVAPFPSVFFGRVLSEFTLGLDLKGGVQMVYDIDTSTVSESDRERALEALRDAIERRVNFFGVREPNVLLERAPGANRLIVELAG